MTEQFDKLINCLNSLGIEYKDLNGKHTKEISFVRSDQVVVFSFHFNDDGYLDTFDKVYVVPDYSCKEQA